MGVVVRTGGPKPQLIEVLVVVTKQTCKLSRYHVVNRRILGRLLLLLLGRLITGNHADSGSDIPPLGMTMIRKGIGNLEDETIQIVQLIKTDSPPQLLLLIHGKIAWKLLTRDADEKCGQ